MPRAAVSDPAGCVALSPSNERDASAFRGADPLGTRELESFGAYLAARAFACLRIIREHRCPEARLATDLPGWALIGRVSHPQDDSSGFRDLPHVSLPPDQHCLVAPTLFRYQDVDERLWEGNPRPGLYGPDGRQPTTIAETDARASRRSRETRLPRAQRGFTTKFENGLSPAITATCASRVDVARPRAQGSNQHARGLICSDPSSHCFR